MRSDGTERRMEICTGNRKGETGTGRKMTGAGDRKAAGRYRGTARLGRDSQFGCLRIPEGYRPARGIRVDSADGTWLPDDWESVRRVILPVLLGANACGGRLSGVPAKKVLDLYLVCGVTVYRPGSVRSSVIPGYPMLDRWNVSIEELFRTASDNAAKESPRLRPLMPGILSGCEVRERGGRREDDGIAGVPEPQGPAGPKDGGQGAGGAAAQLTVCTNREHFLGASEILRPGVLDGFCRSRKVHGCYILPCSIHEVLLFVPQERRNPCELEKMIRRVNRSAVRTTEQLSDRLYRYDLGSGCLSLALGGESVCLTSGTEV